MTLLCRLLPPHIPHVNALLFTACLYQILLVQTKIRMIIFLPLMIAPYLDSQADPTMLVHVTLEKNAC